MKFFFIVYMMEKSLDNNVSIFMIKKLYLIIINLALVEKKDNNTLQ